MVFRLVLVLTCPHCKTKNLFPEGTLSVPTTCVTCKKGLLKVSLHGMDIIEEETEKAY